MRNALRRPGGVNGGYCGGGALARGRAGGRSSARADRERPPGPAAPSSGAPLGGGALADYTRIRTIGRGSFGEALLVQHRSTGRECVLKRVRIEVAGGGEAKGAAESAAREAYVLRQLNHPHIVELLGAFPDPRDPGGGTLCLLMAYCEGGDLQQRLHRSRQDGRRLKEALVLRWFDQLCSAVAYVHHRQVLHRDLKPSNIFLFGNIRGKSAVKCTSAVDDETSLAIGDFGVSRPLSHALELVTTMVGTPCYLSPEVCKGKPYSYKSDVWSLGCVLFEMMVLRPPFGVAPNLEVLVSRIVAADYTVPDGLTNEFPEALKCARAMLRVDSERRPSAQALLSRPRPGPADGMPTRTAAAALAAEASAAANAAVAMAISPRSRGRGRLPGNDVEQKAMQAGQTPAMNPERLRAPGNAALSPRPRTACRRSASQGSAPSAGGYPAGQTPKPQAVAGAAPPVVRRSSSPSTPPIPARGMSVPVHKRLDRQPERSQEELASPQTDSGSQALQSPRSGGSTTAGTPGNPSCDGSQPLSGSPSNEGTQPAADSRCVAAGPSDGSPPPPPCGHPVQEARLKRRREDRVQQSQAFREWLRRQRAACEQQSPTTGDRKTEIYCPGFPVIAGTKPATEIQRRHTARVSMPGSATSAAPPIGATTPGSSLIPTVSAPSSPPLGVVAAQPQNAVVAGVGATTTPSQPWPPKHLSSDSADVIGPCSMSPRNCRSTSGSPEVGMRTSCPPPAVDMVPACRRAGSSSGARCSSPAGPSQSGSLSGCPSPTSRRGTSKDRCEQASDLPRRAEEPKAPNVSIGDRIEGIRACLEARMGTQRFQKLYRSLAKDAATANNVAEALPDELNDVLVGVGDCGSDVNSLVPLVAKLVACENIYFS